MNKKLLNRLIIGLFVLILLFAFVGVVTWEKFFKQEPQHFANELERFKYGSNGTELIAGIPYPIFMILPRVFPDLIDGHGGYSAFGLAWEEGQRLPIGFSIKKIGFERVGTNCALCHTTSWRLKPGDKPNFAIGGPGHTANIGALLKFFFASAEDDRFSSARLLPEMTLNFEFSWLDVLLYKWLIIPATKKTLQLGKRELAWTEKRPTWGPGRDDAFNLPKFILTRKADDGTVGNTDFPALWMLSQRKGQRFHAGGEAKTIYGVIATSSFGAGSLPDSGFESRNLWVEQFVSELPAPSYPLLINDQLKQLGATIFARECEDCHAMGGSRVGSVIPTDEIGTDPEHVKAWQQDDAKRFNRLLKVAGVKNAEMYAAEGYVAKPLVGVWLLAPYLHNGSVPNLRALLAAPSERPLSFYRGYDVIDRLNVGFSTSGPEAEKNGFLFDTRLLGNRNTGHSYGTGLLDDEKEALLEYLKTL